VAKAAKDHAPEHLAELDVIDRLMAHLDAGRPARTFACDDEERVWVDGDVLLTRKPVMVVANVGEIDDDAVEASLSNLNRYFEDAPTTVLPVIAQVEAEINELPTDERQLFLEEMGLEESGLNRVIREAYRLLGLISFYTGNEKEAHAWDDPQGRART
jgi:ribosome-binding ATPase YchF (GTP1/OBG family)